VRCPTCDQLLRVLETRDTVRRRVCPDGHQFTTHEVFVGESTVSRGARPQTPLGPTQLLVRNTLDGRALTIHGLMAALPETSRTQIMDAVRGLRTRRLVYIAGYAPREKVGGGRRPPIYVVGDLPDAREPSVPKKDRDAQYRKRKSSGLWADLVRKKSS
jgi:hypothetical protein